MKLHLDFEFPEEPTSRQIDFLRIALRETTMAAAELLWPNKSYKVEVKVDAREPRVDYHKDQETPQGDRRSYSFKTKDDAVKVVTALEDVIEQFGAATLGDLYELMGMESNVKDEKVGWVDVHPWTLVKHGGAFDLTLPAPKKLRVQ